MKIYERTQFGYESECMPQIIFRIDKITACCIGINELKIRYNADESFPFPVLSSWVSVLTQDIHNNIPCGKMLVTIPSSETTNDVIEYIIRFEKKEFNKIKKFFLTNVPK